MRKILDANNLFKLKRQKKIGGKLVLVGGCFDVLHRGHIEFLRRAKALGGILVVMLESDDKIRKLKGDKRPINSRDVRATNLSKLPFVDYVINLPYFSKNQNYETLVKQVEPDIIALTEGSIIYDWERVYMNKRGGKIVEVIKRLEDYSTTKLTQVAKGKTVLS